VSINEPCLVGYASVGMEDQDLSLQLDALQRHGVAFSQFPIRDGQHVAAEARRNDSANRARSSV
jgi:hypothetical protein